MFGIYDFFPSSYHGIAFLSFTSSKKNIQEAIIHTFYNLNFRKKKIDYKQLTDFNVEHHLEIGLAEELTFNFIDDKILLDFIKEKHGKTFQKLDFLCIACCYIKKKKSSRPLRFDYFLIRFSFFRDNIELRIYHEKGTFRVSIEDLVSFLIDEIKKELQTKTHDNLDIVSLRSV